MRHEALLVGVLLAAACSSGGGDGDGPDVNPAFAGRWTGHATVTFPQSGGGYFYSRIGLPADLRISTSGRTAEISGTLCLEGTQAVVAQATGDPNTLEWNGAPGNNVECAIFYTGMTGCFFSYRYQHLVARMIDGALSLQATGSAAGCYSAGSATLDFPGVGLPPPRPAVGSR